MTRINSGQVKVFVVRQFDRQLQYLLLQRHPGDPRGEPKWQVIHGKLRAGEGYAACARREVVEELSALPRGFFALRDLDQYYDEAQDEIVCCPIFVAELNHDDTISLSYEHNAARWVSLDEAEQYCGDTQLATMHVISAQFFERSVVWSAQK